MSRSPQWPSAVTDLRGARITVMGVGAHDGGVGATRYLARHGASVLLTDVAPGPLLRTSLRELDSVCRHLVLGRHRVEDFVAADVVVRSPAIFDSDRYVRAARSAGVPVVLDLDLFFRSCPTANIIAVSGTKGKSTVAMMIARVLEHAGMHVVAAGNMGISPLNRLDELTPESWIVLELSSFQLEMLGVGLPRSRYAVLTNVYPAHVAEHGSHERYVAAKRRLVTDEFPTDLALIGSGVSCESAVTSRGRARVRRYRDEDLPSAWPIGVVGVHNRENAAAALAIAREIGIPDLVTAQALASFRPLPGRIEHIVTVDGVRVYNDSKCGIDRATAMAIGAMAGPTVLIWGGSDAGFDPEPLRTSQLGNLKAAVATPSDRYDLMERALPGVPMHRAESLEHAVELALGVSEAGDCILYSSPFHDYPPPPRSYLIGRRTMLERSRDFDRAVATVATRLGRTAAR